MPMKPETLVRLWAHNGRKERAIISAAGIASHHGFYFVRGTGRPSVQCDTAWLSRFEDHDGNAIFVGFDHATDRVLIETESGVIPDPRR